MSVVVFLLAGKTGALCFSSPTPIRPLFGSRLMDLALTLSPLVFSTWVAISRMEDYVRKVISHRFTTYAASQRHHKEDIIVGSTIGILSAWLTYLTFWPSPFNPDSFHPDVHGMPRASHRASQEPCRLPRSGYELHRSEDPENV